MHIRSYQDSDQAAVIALWHACELTRPWNDPVKDVARKLTVQPELLLIGEANGTLIGTAMAGYDGHRGWLYYLAIAPEHRRRGHARALVAAACDRLRALGCPKVELMVRESNTRSRDFYGSVGFAREPVDVLSLRLIADG